MRACARAPSRSASCAPARTTSSRSTPARCSPRSSPTRRKSPARLAECVKGLAKPLDIQATATLGGLDVDMRGSGSLGPARDAQAHCGRGTLRSGADFQPRRRDHRAPACGRRLRAGARGPASRRVPSGDGGGRGDAGEPRGEGAQRGRTGRGPVLRRRRLRSAALGHPCRFRRRQRCGRRCGAAPRGAKRGRGGRARSLPPAADLRRAVAFRRRAVRSAARRGGASGARNRGRAGSGASRRSPATPKPSRAMRAFSRRAVTFARASRPLTSSATRPMSRSSRPFAAPRRNGEGVC